MRGLSASKYSGKKKGPGAYLRHYSPFQPLSPCKNSFNLWLVVYSSRCNSGSSYEQFCLCTHTYTHSTFPGHDETQTLVKTHFSHTELALAEVCAGLLVEQLVSICGCRSSIWVVLLWQDTQRPATTHSCVLLLSHSLQSKTQLVTSSICSAAFNMDVPAAWATANPAMAQLLWVLVLMLVTLLLWLCFCCYIWNQSTSPSLEKYLAGMWCPESSSIWFYIEAS